MHFHYADCNVNQAKKYKSNIHLTAIKGLILKAGVKQDRLP